MALDILTIPAMTTDCESSFSIAKLTLSSQRHAVKWETTEMLPLLKNWPRNSTIIIWGGDKGRLGLGTVREAVGSRITLFVD